MKTKLKYPILVLVLGIVTAVFVHLIRTEQSLYPVAYAFQLFGTLIHEIGHSTAALISGGSVKGFVVNASSGGFARIAGGSALLVLPAGYFGSAVFGSAFLYLANRYRRMTDTSAFMIGVFIIFFTVVFGRPEENGEFTAHYVALAFGTILALVGYSGNVWLSLLLVNIVSAMSALQGFMGAWALHVLSQPDHHNDANMMADAFPILDGNSWALIWAVMSVILFLIAFYHGPLKTMLGKREFDYSW